MLHRVLMVFLGSVLLHGSLQAAVVFPAGSWPLNDDGIRITQTRLDQIDAQFCADTPQGNAEDFAGYLFGQLPQAIFAATCDAPDADRPQLLGDLYVSGFLGGVWLRDLLPNDDALGIARQWLVQQLNSKPLPVPFADASAAAVFPALQRAVAQYQALQSAPAARRMQAVRNQLPLFLAVTGYNKGYLDYILAHPPQGTPPFPIEIDCASLIDCMIEGWQQPSTALLSDVSHALQSGDVRARWHAMQLQTAQVSASRVGAAVWSNIGLANANEQAYLQLVNLSALFLWVTQQVDVYALHASLYQNDASARCALHQQQALLVWMGAYFAGLASNQSGEFLGAAHCE